MKIYKIAVSEQTAEMQRAAEAMALVATDAETFMGHASDAANAMRDINLPDMADQLEGLVASMEMIQQMSSTMTMQSENMNNMNGMDNMGGYSGMGFTGNRGQ